MPSIRFLPGADAPMAVVSESSPVSAAPPSGGPVLRPGQRRLSTLGLHPFRFLFERRVHRTGAEYKELLWTAANGVTIARLIVTTIVMLVAIVEHSPALLLAGLLASWLLDIADGLLARRQERETVIGAQLDILADRVAAMWVVLGVVVFDHAALLTVAAAGAVWVQLSFFDQLLAGQFLRFGHWSPDEFHLEDGDVWRLNWAPAAKVIGNLPLGLLMIGGRWLWVALALALLLIFVRVFSYLRILRRIELLAAPRVDEDSPAPEALRAGALASHSST